MQETAFLLDVPGLHMNQMDTVIKKEWDYFQLVQNEGGRAACQDDWETFQIMRESQFTSWSKELLDSYEDDLIKADARGWNPVFEKYARMMKSTVPEQYETLKEVLPEISKERETTMEKIIKIQVIWMEDFAQRYPKLMGNARMIHTAEDTMYETSSETYLRGELSTYSEHTLKLYQAFIDALQHEGRNLTEIINRHMVKRYGYPDFETAENSI